MTQVMLITLSSTVLAGTTPSGAFGPEARYIDGEARSTWQSLRGARVFGYSEMFADLSRLALECSVPDWDGYGAAPIRPETVSNAHRFVQALPLGTPPPALGAEPDGHVTFEWHSSPKWTLSVSISPDGNLHYAALLGSARQYGTEPFLGDLPAPIHDLIARVAQK